MNEEQILKLNAYIMEVCHEYEHCNTCPFNHEQSGTCLITFIRKRLRALSNTNTFDTVSEEKYGELAEEVSLEEIKFELADFADEHCAGFSCNNCCFGSRAIGRCALCVVEDVLKKKIETP